MSTKYKIRDQQKLYFVSFAVIYWLDVFIKRIQNYPARQFEAFQKTNGLEIYAWCIMKPCSFDHWYFWK